MAYFSENDINEAKRRVSDMQKRANRLTNQEESVKEPPKIFRGMLKMLKKPKREKRRKTKIRIF